MKALLIERCAVCPFLECKEKNISLVYEERYFCGRTGRRRLTIENVPRWCPLDNVRVTRIRKTNKVQS